MEIRKVSEIPTAHKELNKENMKFLKGAEELKELEVMEVTPEKGKEAKHMVSGFKNAAKRLKPKTFKFRVRGNKVYVQREKTTSSDEKKK